MVSSEVRLFLPMLHTPVASLGHAALIMLLELLWYKFQIKFISRRKKKKRKWMYIEFNSFKTRSQERFSENCQVMVSVWSVHFVTGKPMLDFELLPSQCIYNV